MTEQDRFIYQLQLEREIKDQLRPFESVNDILSIVAVAYPYWFISKSGNNTVDSIIFLFSLFPMVTKIIIDFTFKSKQNLKRIKEDTIYLLKKRYKLVISMVYVLFSISILALVLVGVATYQNLYKEQNPTAFYKNAMRVNEAAGKYITSFGLVEEARADMK